MKIKFYRGKHEIVLLSPVIWGQLSVSLGTYNWVSRIGRYIYADWHLITWQNGVRNWINPLPSMTMDGYTRIGNAYFTCNVVAM